MSDRSPRIIGTSLAGVVVLYALFCCIGIGWGLPSSAHDVFLFGDGVAWDGEALTRLVGGGVRADPRIGADVDVDPLDDRTGPVVLNDGAQAQAEIYRRFRLFTTQPDEMITMMALSGMNPRQGQFDPKLYQYGGLFIYPVGALIRMCGALGLFPVRGDLAYYLDQPDDFGKFYVAGRLYSCAWGVWGVFLVYAIGRRLGGAAAGIIAALLCVMLPVMVCMSHEAKPHLPGAVLMLAAVWFGMRALEAPSRRNWAGLFVCCGAAVGMVLSSLPIFVLVPLVVGLRCLNKGARKSCVPFLRATVGGWGVATGVYVITNPYVVINLLINREVLASNFGNSLAMYEVSRVAEGCVRVLQLTVEGATWPVILGGALALIAAARKRKRGALPLAVPAAVLVLQFVLIGAGKPDEYGRFGIFYECALAIGCGCVLAAAARRWLVAGGALTFAVGAWCAVCAGGYLWSFHADAAGVGSRDRAAAYLAENVGAESVALVAEPAPYSCPPMDFARTPVVLYRKGPREKARDGIRSWNDAIRSATPAEGALPPGFLVAALDDPAADLAGIDSPAWDVSEVFESRLSFLPRSEISWANKPIVVLTWSPD